MRDGWMIPGSDLALLCLLGIREMRDERVRRMGRGRLIEG